MEAETPSDDQAKRVRSPWRAIVLSRIDALEAELERLTPTEVPDDVVRQQGAGQIGGLLTNAREAASRGSFYSRRWAGADIERAWRSVHEAEVALARLQTSETIRAQHPALVAVARNILGSDDPRRTAIEQWDPSKAGDQLADQARYAVSLGWLYSESDDAHNRVRSFRNVLLAVTLAMTAVAAGLVIVGIVAPNAIPICVQPAAGDPICPTGVHPPSRNDVPIVAFVGIVGAALASALAIRNIHGTQTPYGVPLALAILKLPTGAVTALAGIILMQGEFVPGLSELDSSAQVLGYAILLGFGQEAFTHFVDRRGQEVLTSAPGFDLLAPDRETGSGGPPSPPPDSGGDGPLET